jgi:hypothetical protein
MLQRQFEKFTRLFLSTIVPAGAAEAQQACTGPVAPLYSTTQDVQMCGSQLALLIWCPLYRSAMNIIDFIPQFCLLKF